jgi:sugar phosphate isomerase/epimerase
LKTSFCSIAYRSKSQATIFEIIRDVKSAGYDGVEVWWPHVEGKSDTQLSEVAAAAREVRLEIPILSPYLGNFNLPMTNYDEIVARIRASAPVAAKLGAPLLRAFVGWTCECSSLTASEEYWRFNLKGFREMAMIAADYGRTIAMETHSMTLVDSVAGVKRMIEEGDSRLRVNFQLDTMAENSRLPDGVAVYEALKPLIVHMHAHVPETAAAGEEEGRVMQTMKRDKFGGFVSAEHCSGKGEPTDAVAAGIKFLKKWV